MPTFGPSEYIGADNASIRTPTNVSPTIGYVLAYVSAGQTDWVPNGGSVTSGSIVAALGYVPVNPASLGTLAFQNNTLSGSNTGDETTATIRSKLGITVLSGSNTGDQDLSILAVKANNLSDLASASAARSNLGLGTLATQSGTFSGSSSGSNTGDNAVNSLYSGLVSNASHTGDATGSTVLTLATVNANVGSFGDATASPVVTVNAKGLVTAVSTITVTPAVGSITGLGTGWAAALVSAYSSGAIITALGYTPANDSTVMHLTGAETAAGAKTFSGALTANAGVTTTAVTASGAINSTTGLSNFYWMTVGTWPSTPVNTNDLNIGIYGISSLGAISCGKAGAAISYTNRAFDFGGWAWVQLSTANDLVLASYTSLEAIRLVQAGGIKFTGGITMAIPAGTATPATNGDLVVERTSNTVLTFKLRGTDGVVRSGTITLT